MSKNWSGSFTSNYYNFLGINMVSGNIKVTLPIDITQTDTFATLTFTGIYRRGVTVELDFKYSTPYLIGSFKESSQIIKFTPTSLNLNTINGTYTSENPYDRGSFSMIVDIDVITKHVQNEMCDEDEEDEQIEKDKQKSILQTPCNLKII